MGLLRSFLLPLGLAANTACCPVVFAAADIEALPPHPRLLLDKADVEDLRQRITQSPWAPQWRQYKAGVDKQLARPVVLPPRGGNWSHNYVCPIHGARLRQGKRIGTWEWEHRCPVGNHLLRGDSGKAALDFDGNGISDAHGSYAALLRDAGVVYQVTGQRRYADKAREILMAYAARYLSYPRHDNQGRPRGGGRVASQSLSEASWLIHMAQGADLIWDTLNPEQCRAVEEKLFRPALEQVILPSHHGIHNIQCRINSAIGLAGYLLGDPRLVRTAIDDPQAGFRQQIQRGVRDDGMWCEGASGYHFFTIEGLWPLAEAARHCGLNLYEARFKSMFDGPLALAMPNLALPAFNDSGTVWLTSRADLYELAYARWHDARYAPLLAAGRHTGELALWFGAAPPKSELGNGRGSRNSPASGYAILERGAGDQATWLCLKYGPHGGGHGHNDKNQLVLYSRGQVLMPDPGTHAYGSPLHTSWDKTTLAHNTLIVDEQSQAPAQGRCLAFGAVGGVDYAMTEAGPIYPGVRFVRTAALLSENLIVIVDQVCAGQEHQFDIACHLAGKWSRLPEGEPWTPPGANGYKHIAHAAFRAGASGMTAVALLESGGESALTLAGGEPTQFITGTGIGASTEDRVPIALLRRRAKETAFVWAVALDGKPVQLETLAARDADGKTLPAAAATAVTIRSGDKRWALLVNPAGQPVQASLPEGTWTSSELFAVRAP